MVSRSTTDIGKAAVSGNPREEPGIMLPKEVFGEEGKEKGTRSKVERIGSMESPRRVVRRAVEHTVSSNSWTPKHFFDG